MVFLKGDAHRVPEHKGIRDSLRETASVRLPDPRELQLRIKLGGASQPGSSPHLPKPCPDTWAQVTSAKGDENNGLFCRGAGKGEQRQQERPDCNISPSQTVRGWWPSACSQLGRTLL